MNKLSYYIPDDIPKEFLKFDKKVEQLGVGKSGKVGILDLELQSNKNGKTVITKQFSQVPLQIQRALYPEDSIPNMAYVYIVSPSGGILQGDRYRIDILLKKKAISHFTTQGASRIYSMNSNSASQILNITLEEDCYLEFIPDQIIPFKNSRYYQKVTLNINSNSTLIYSEIVTPGRVAMKEAFEYDICFLRTQCYNQDRKIIFQENTKIEPKNQKISEFGILGDNTVFGTIYILTRKVKLEKLEEVINKRLKELDECSIGTSILPDNSGIIIRILGKETEKIIREISKILEVCREKILCKKFSKVRKN